MPKKSKKSVRYYPSTLFRHRPLIIFGSLIIVAVIVYTGCYAWAATQNNHRLRDQAAIEPIRELILAATSNLGVDAPVEPRTGDVYFPQAKLYLPASTALDGISFKYAWDNESRELAIVNKLVYGSASAKLIQAANVEDLFANVPELQACSRGVIVSRDKASSTTNGRVLRQTVQLANGDVVYLSSEDACPPNTETAKLLNELRSY